MRPRNRLTSSFALCGLFLCPSLGTTETTETRAAATPGSRAVRLERERAALLLSRATYGARPGDLDAVVAMGSDVWLERQLDPQRIDDSALEQKLSARFPDSELSTGELMAKYPKPSKAQQKAMKELRTAMDDGEGDGDRRALRAMRREMGAGAPGRRPLVGLTEAKLMRAVESERQLQEVMVDFWFNHFNVFARKSRPTSLALSSFERDAIRPHAMGRFEDLLIATAQHPAMLLYLDNWLNAKSDFDPSQARPRQAGPRAERRQRERRRARSGFAQRGSAAGSPNDKLNKKRRKFDINENYARELLELHTLGVDGGYSQADVIAVARCLTGWTTLDPDRSRRRRGNGERDPQSRMDGDFHFIAAMHDGDPKQVLGRRITAGGIDDGLEVLRMLGQHPSTARRIASKLAQRFVSDDPSEALIALLADTYLRSRGDIETVLRALFASPRFVAEGTSAAKVKTPLELVASALRATEARFIHGRGLTKTLEEMGMPLYLCQPPTGYDEAADVWLSAGSMLSRLRFIGALARGDVDGVWQPLPPADLDRWAQSIVLSAPELSRDDQATLREALGEFPEQDSGDKAVAMALLMASPAFQQQ